MQETTFNIAIVKQFNEISAIDVSSENIFI